MKEIIKIFEKRKQDLIARLRDYSEILEPAKQHQLYGAINEIDVFVTTLNHYQKKQQEQSIAVKNPTNEIKYI